MKPGRPRGGSGTVMLSRHPGLDFSEEAPMQRWYSIGLDTHSRTVEMAALSPSGQRVRRDRCTTTIPAILTMVQAVPKPRRVALEEGPLADWLWRNLTARGETVTVCDPRRNRLIAAESDKDDPIDAA